MESAVFTGPYDVAVRRYGAIALVTGGYRVTGSAGAVELRFTGAWIDRRGRWQCLVHHNSAVS